MLYSILSNKFMNLNKRYGYFHLCYCGQPQVNFYFKIFWFHFISVNNARPRITFNAGNCVPKDQCHTAHVQLWFKEAWKKVNYSLRRYLNIEQYKFVALESTYIFPKLRPFVSMRRTYSPSVWDDFTRLVSLTRSNYYFVRFFLSLKRVSSDKRTYTMRLLFCNK